MAETYEVISTTTLASAINTVTLSSIPQTYTDLFLVMNNIREVTAQPSVISYRYNGDTAANYSTTYIGYSAAGGVYSGRRVSDTGIWLGGMYSPRGMFTMNIMNYTNTTTYKSSVSRMATYGTAYESSSSYTGLWRASAAISSLTIYSMDITPNFDVGATFTLYGIKAA